MASIFGLGAIKLNQTNSPTEVKGLFDTPSDFGANHQIENPLFLNIHLD
jgi:hypothetical protein